MGPGGGVSFGTGWVRTRVAIGGRGGVQYALADIPTLVVGDPMQGGGPARGAMMGGQGWAFLSI